MPLNRLTICRASLLKTLDDAISVPVITIGDTPDRVARQYVEIRFPDLDTEETSDTEIKLSINVITIPAPDTNAFSYIDLANQIHDLLRGLAVSVSGVGCIQQVGTIHVHDLGFVNPEQTIQQANVVCTFLLET